jgi:hypothetical protein
MSVTRGRDCRAVRLVCPATMLSCEVLPVLPVESIVVFAGAPRYMRRPEPSVFPCMSRCDCCCCILSFHRSCASAITCLLRSKSTANCCISVSSLSIHCLSDSTQSVCCGSDSRSCARCSVLRFLCRADGIPVNHLRRATKNRICHPRRT